MMSRDERSSEHDDRAPKLGELLVAQGAISPEQLKTALERQKTSGRRLGEELIKLGFVKRSVVNRALRMQRRIAAAVVCALVISATPHGAGLTSYFAGARSVLKQSISII
jgi:hypothetical protein